MKINKKLLVASILLSSTSFATEDFKAIIHQFSFGDQILKEQPHYIIEEPIDTTPPVTPPLTPPDPEPDPITPSPAGLNFVEGGISTTFALDSNGNVWSVGDNNFSQLGRAIQGGNSPGDHTWRITSMNDVVDMSVTQRNILAVKSNGQVWSAGNNGYNSYTANTWVNTNAPTKAVSVSTGKKYAFYIDESNDLYARGENFYGVFGNGNQTHSQSWKKVASGIKEAYAGVDTAYAIKTDGTLLVAGTNYNGLLGTSAVCSGSLSCYTTNWIPSATGINIDKIDIGTNRAVILDASGIMHVVGRGGNNVLGNINSSLASNWTVMSDSFTSGSIKEVNFNLDGSILALDSNDDLWAIGRNTHNVLGHPSGTSSVSYLNSWYKTNSDVKTIMESSFTSSIIQKNDGEFFIVGSNWRGALGLDTMPTGVMTNWMKLTLDAN